MKSLNKTISLIILLSIHIVCITCSSSEENEEINEEAGGSNPDTKKCEDDIYLEFKNEQPLDDFVHAFLNIKFERIYWNENTDINEHFYRGNDELKPSAIDYYKELLNIALEMGLPELSTPQDFCRINHRSDEENCISALEEIGCGIHVSSSDCFQKMYFNWKKTNADYRSLSGTENLSDAELLEAICRGYYKFCNLTDEQLFERFANRSDIIQDLSDDNLLREMGLDPHYRRYQSSRNREPESSRYIRSRSGRQRRYGFYGGSGSSTAYMQYVSDQLDDRQYEMNVQQARLIKYGISGASYATICHDSTIKSLNSADDLDSSLILLTTLFLAAATFMINTEVFPGNSIILTYWLVLTQKKVFRSTYCVVYTNNKGQSINNSINCLNKQATILLFTFTTVNEKQVLRQRLKVDNHRFWI